MKVFVLTHCASENNYTPKVFTDKTKAVEALKEKYDSLVSSSDYIVENEIFNTKAHIDYADDTYDVLEVFEVEVE